MDGKETTPRPKRPKKKWVITGAVAAAVLAAGVGLWVWHEQPSFCGTVCHNVMGSYVEGYEDTDSDTLVATHAKLGYTCLDCHEPTLEEQVAELGVYVSGDYTVPLEESGIGTRAFCSGQGCHDDWESIVEATSDYTGTVTVYNRDGIYNPHSNHRGNSDCGDCHKVHGQSELKCAECHEVKVPDGWLGYE